MNCPTRWSYANIVLLVLCVVSLNGSDGKFDFRDNLSSGEEKLPSTSSSWDDFVVICREAVLYKPPVGIVAVLTVARLLSGRLFSVYPKSNEVLPQQTTQTMIHSREVDKYDADYEEFGGIESTRTRLLRAVVEDEVIQEALYVTCPPGVSRSIVVERMAAPLAEISIVLVDSKSDNFSVLAAKAAEVRALDALLRQFRDGLLRTCSRLVRLERYWKRRVAIRRWTLVSYFRRRIARFPLLAKSSSLEGDRARLAIAKAALAAELDRLGSIQSMLLNRPAEMAQDLLLKTVNHGDDSTSAKKGGNDKSLPFVSRFALRWNADGRNLLSVGFFDGPSSINEMGARKVLTEDGDIARWLKDARDWTRQARSVLFETINDTLETNNADPVMYEKMRTLKEWSQYQPEVCKQQSSWTEVLTLANYAGASLRRAGESRMFGLNEVLFLNWFERLDVFGIPSSLLAIYAAGVVHKKLTPRWPELYAALRSTYNIVWGIVQKRFWEPLVAIVSDLINKSPKLLDSFDLDVEEESLDHMLQDLGVGDGTPASRKNALKGAASLYEEYLKHGVVTNLLRGRLIRLMLVQIQQLKAGLLKAMGSIDALVDSNRLNVQLLAAIPAVLLVALSSKLFIGLLVGYRTKNYLRPIAGIYNEMTEFLHQMEASLVQRDSSASSLGEFTLFVYSYLALLDYCSPPFPRRSRDSIRSQLQALFSYDYLVDAQTTLSLLSIVKDKHRDLQKHL